MPGANREKRPSPTAVEDKEALLRRGERWKLRSARAEISKDACSRCRRTAKTTTLYPRTSDYYRSRCLSPRGEDACLRSFPYNGLKCTCQDVNTPVNLVRCPIFLWDFTNAFVITLSLLQLIVSSLSFWNLNPERDKESSKVRLKLIFAT